MNEQSLPLFYRIETIDGYTVYINVSNIDSIINNSTNSNWSDIYIVGGTNIYSVRLSPEELISSITNEFINSKNTLTRFTTYK